MKKEFSSSASWNSAAVAGLIMAISTIAADYISSLPVLLGAKGFISGLVVYLLKFVKIVACVYVFRILMLRFHNTVSADYTKLQHYGLKIALFSSILVAGFSLAQILVINPDTMTQMVQEVESAYQNMMDSNTMAAMEKMMSKLPVITFFSSLVYCYIWGWILSTAFARKLFPVDPFGDRSQNNTSNGNNNLQ